VESVTALSHYSVAKTFNGIHADGAFLSNDLFGNGRHFINFDSDLITIEPTIWYMTQSISIFLQICRKFATTKNF
jgi:hypothetical protein